MNLPLPLLFRTSFRRGKDFDQLMIVPFSLYSNVEMKFNFEQIFRKAISLIMRNSGNSQTSVCRRKCSYPAVGLVSSSVLIKTDLKSRSSSVSSSGSMMIIASFKQVLSLTCATRVVLSKTTLFFDLWHGKHSVSHVPCCSF